MLIKIKELQHQQERRPVGVVTQFINGFSLGVLDRADGDIQFLGDFPDGFSLDGLLDDFSAPLAQPLNADPETAVHLLADGNCKIIICPSLFMDVVKIGMGNGNLDNVFLRAVDRHTVVIHRPIKIESKVMHVFEHDLLMPYIGKSLLHDILCLATGIDIILGITAQSSIEAVEENLPCFLIPLIDF